MNDAPAPTLGFAVQAALYDGSVIEAEFLRRWTSDGTVRFLRSADFEHTGELLDLVPEHSEVLLACCKDGSSDVLAATQDAIALLAARSTSVTAQVAGATDDLAATVLAAICTRREDMTDDGLVRLATWHLVGRAAACTFRRLEMPSWDRISLNYPLGARKLLERTMGLDRPNGAGRLLLWHGPPGTGKTTAIRALMREWQSWCSPHYVADPERMFGDPDYLSRVLSTQVERVTAHRPEGERVEAPWVLVVAEDTDDYLRVSAKGKAGSSMGRLLNVTDGILGQGLNALILLTTNEPVSSLHPAITRPGRCLSVVEFPTFTTAEAQAWLGSDGPMVSGPKTLAELLELRGDLRQVDASLQLATANGAYL